MVPVKLTTLAPERGTYIITASFQDENGDSVIPNAATTTWTLTDGLGTVVNSRLQVAITSAATINIVLSGLDLAVGGDLNGRDRKLLIEALYNSSLGNNLPVKAEIAFRIADFTYPSGSS